MPSDPELTAAGGNPFGSWKEPPELYCMPRRYGIGTLLVISTFYGCLIAALQAINAPWQMVLWCCLLFLVVGLFQMFSRPALARWASILAGVLFMFVFGLLIGLLYSPRITHPGRSFVVVCITVTGPVVGYVAGAVVGGVFLIMDAVERLLRRRGPEVVQAELADPPENESQNSA
jgi:hypothetical protein